jgi:hypothetical protein
MTSGPDRVRAFFDAGWTVRTFTQGLSTQQLLLASQEVIRELRHRRVVRSANAPAGDYAEWLVVQAVRGVLQEKSKKSYDVLMGEQRLQVKARVVADMKRKRYRALSVIRTWDFERFVTVLFNEESEVMRASSIPTEAARAVAYWSKAQNGHLIYATDDLLAKGEDWTGRVRAAAGNDEE